MTQPPRAADSPDAHASGEESFEASTLADRLRARIRREGALTFCEWMRAALYDEREGYYRRRDRARWGREGDYRTSPERSRLFAATFARHFVALYEELGRPRRLCIVEAGGGGGHFARGVLETLERDAPHVFFNLQYVFEDVSADSRSRAGELLASFRGRVEFKSPGELDAINAPLDSGIIFSNELLDALPVHRVIVKGGKLLELCVGLSNSSAFVWEEREASTPRLAEHFKSAGIILAEGQCAEVNLEAEDWIARAAAKVSQGYVITVDYGDEAADLYNARHRPEGTLRAFRGHAFARDILDSPGEQDLTTTVNWTQLRKAGERHGLATLSLERQDRFLLRAGLLEQLEHESTAAGRESEVARLRLDAREMILPNGMSEHFQVLVQKKVGAI
ncbi:MAG: SAM-dependent methyltransferase [Pyrinomonadaceae bacterium]